MRKLSVLLLLFITLSLIFALCSCSSGDVVDEDTIDMRKYPIKNLNVYNWGEYISDEDDEECGLFNVNEAFEEYFNKNLADKYQCYIKVNYSTYATNEDMYAKLTNSAVNYDVVIPSDYMIQKMIGEGLLRPIDFGIVTNYSNIDSQFIDNCPYDTENKYSVPYSYGMVGIIYNSEFVDEEDVKDESWGLMWNEKYKGKILQFNNPRDAFATAMYFNNININSDNTADWDFALSELLRQKPLLQGYVNDEIFNKMKGASAYISAYFAGDYLTMAADNNDLKFYYPTEGTNYFVDAMCIPTTCKDESYPLANEYINYMTSVEAGTANALYIGYATPNAAVRNDEYYIEMLHYNYSIEDEETGELILDAEEVLYGKSKDEANVNYSFPPAYENYKNNGTDIQAYVIALWESLKTENSTELWVHITSITIVVGLLSFGIYTTYVRKKRSRFYRIKK